MRLAGARIPRAFPRARLPLIPIAAIAILAAAALASNELSSPHPTLDVAASVDSMSYTFGAENSWVRVQNIGANPATVNVSYYNESGQLVGQDSCPSAACPPIGPGQGWTFFQASQPQLAFGYRGSAVVDSDQPIVALQAKDIRRNGAFLIDGHTTTTNAGSSRMYLPQISSHDGPQQDWNGRFAVENLSDTVACVTLTYVSNYTDSEIAWDPYKLGTSGSKQQFCPNGGRPLAAHATLFRDPDTFGVPGGFTGSVRIETSDNALGVKADQQKLLATADTWNSIYNPFASYRAIDQSEMSQTVLLPLVDREVGPNNGYSTHFEIENKDPSKPAIVRVQFSGYDLDHGGAFVAKEALFGIAGARLCFQDRDDYANCLAPGDALPHNFVGTARVTATQPIGVIASRSNRFGDNYTDYRASRPEDAGTRVLLPVMNKNYGPYQGHSGWNSYFRVLVADGGYANVRIRYLGLDLPGGEQSYTIGVNREATVFQPAEAMLPNGFAGTAILESDRPIVALANLSTDVFTGDTDLLYNGIALR